MPEDYFQTGNIHVRSGCVSERDISLVALKGLILLREGSVWDIWDWLQLGDETVLCGISGTGCS
jgi:hypothetical protein